MNGLIREAHCVAESVSRAFLSFDYGPEGNLRHYGTQTPIDYMAHYHLIDQL
ncbi:hypothetical protein T484DRAFT_1833563 [Baffinella frigidus]|nr:hypothetical protein T484DRAFT_1833563 [Cryptophyta sp. CCMP2293]